jgi:hypothetical protein
MILVPATNAQAASYGCTGSQVGSWPVSDGIHPAVGDIKLYYDAGTGWNCAVMVKRTSFGLYGQNSGVTISINNSRWGDGVPAHGNYDIDGGQYKYYAGPAKVYGRGMCIYLMGSAASTVNPDQEHRYVRHVRGVACG